MLHGASDRVARRARRRGLPGRGERQDGAAPGERDASRRTQRRFTAPRRCGLAWRADAERRVVEPLPRRAPSPASASAVASPTRASSAPPGVFAALPVNAHRPRRAAAPPAYRLDDRFCHRSHVRRRSWPDTAATGAAPTGRLNPLRCRGTRHARPLGRHVAGAGSSSRPVDFRRRGSGGDRALRVPNERCRRGTGVDGRRSRTCRQRQRVRRHAPDERARSSVFT